MISWLAVPDRNVSVLLFNANFMVTRQQLKDLALLRLKEAEALFAAGLFDGCAYLCGYVVELALKARICATLGVNE